MLPFDYSESRSGDLVVNGDRRLSNHYFNRRAKADCGKARVPASIFRYILLKLRPPVV